MQKAQSSVEFASLVTVMLLIFTVFLYAVSERLVEIQKENDRIALEDLGGYIQSELMLATGAVDGYQRVFELPPTIAGREYNITINEAEAGKINHTELVIRYVNYSVGYEFVFSLPLNVTGSIDHKLTTRVKVWKENNVVYVNTKKALGELCFKDEECESVICGTDADGDHYFNRTIGHIGTCHDVLYPYTDCADSNEFIKPGATEICTDHIDNDCDDLRDYDDSEDCPLPPGAYRFLIKNSAGEIAGWFDDDGNVVLKGVLEEDPTYPATSGDEFRFQDSDGNDVMIVDMDNGNMYIDGTLHDNQETLTPQEGSHDFIVQDITGSVVAFVNENGDLYLKGNVIGIP